MALHTFRESVLKVAASDSVEPWKTKKNIIYVVLDSLFTFTFIASLDII